MNKEILDRFIAEKYTRILCEKCELTFLTNVYDFDSTHVLLEKRSLGLEYYCGAIHEKGLNKVPNILRVGIIDEDNNIVKAPSHSEVYSGEETELRFIYVMEKLTHLEEDDIQYFNCCVKDLEWEKEVDREKIFSDIAKRYNTDLAQDIIKLYEYYNKHENVLAWDLHGDNLMQRAETKEIVILDPYTRQA